MRIIVDGLPEEVAEGITLARLIAERGEDSIELIAEINHRYVHPRDYESTVIRGNDRVELIQAAFGG